MKWSGDVRRYVYRHLGYLRVNSFVWKWSKHPQWRPPQGAAGRTLCLNFSLGFVFFCFQPHIRAGMRKDVSSSEALGDTGVVWTGPWKNVFRVTSNPQGRFRQHASLIVAINYAIDATNMTNKHICVYRNNLPVSFVIFIIIIFSLAVRFLTTRCC